VIVPQHRTGEVRPAADQRRIQALCSPAIARPIQIAAREARLDRRSDNG